MTKIKDQEQEIIDTADEWKKKEYEIEKARIQSQDRERDYLHRERQMAHNRKMSGIKRFFVVGLVLGSLAVSCPYINDSYNRWRDRAAIEEIAQQERLEAGRAGREGHEAAKEAAWETLVKNQGIEGASLVEERILKTCYDEEFNTNEIESCLEKRLRDLGVLE